ncbi:ParA family protein [Nodosilinea sp. LEGE 07298]|uniref:ParA family protein n=1 Tax=Nodosilinea sp. LEGE 07298 TaxID=2777970 RepID=UPI00187FBCFC|nr:ParA family protein [Nodosilinea sp. LEGE 07298]MBE9108274.1 ParA family protein [Nodosilinea sp. LEGE 07298]
MPHVIALFNMSGGVGKSTLTMNLGYHLAADHKKRVLLIDMDPQASLTTFMGLTPFNLENTIYHSLLNKGALPIEKDVLGCDLVPANIFLSQAELKLSSELRREYKLADTLAKETSEYDVILIDCPPSLGLLSVNCLVAASTLLIPIQTEYKSVEATINLLQTTYEIAQEVNPKLKVLGAIPTMYDERTSQARRALETIEEMFLGLQNNPSFKGAVVFPPIPRRTDFANATAEHVPLALYAPRHPALEPLEVITRAMVKGL